MNKLWNTWKFALGSFADETTKPYDNHVVLIRTFWVILHTATCCAIIAGNGRVLGIW